MPRPQKYTVDYFPHLCKQGKTMYILEARYGNDGYAFWFKLLEILATSQGHYFVANDPIQSEFLGAKTGFPTEKTGEILSLLATIDAIDKDLWENHKVIWCQHLVDNIAEVYDSRTGLLPDKPYILDGKLSQNIDNHLRNLISPTSNTGTKLKETRLDKTNIYSIFSLWNSQQIIQHNKLTDDIKRAIEIRLKDFSPDEICKAIKNYAEILGGEQYYFKYKWTLRDFLKRGLEKFIDLEIAKRNYQQDDDLKGSPKATKGDNRPSKYQTTN